LNFIIGAAGTSNIASNWLVVIFDLGYLLVQKPWYY